MNTTNEHIAQACDRTGEECTMPREEMDAVRCESCDGSGRVVETIDVDVPGHPHHCRGGSYQAMVTCDDCEGVGRLALAQTKEQQQ